MDLPKSETDLTKSERDLPKSDTDLIKSDTDLPRSERELVKSEPDLGTWLTDLSKSKPDKGTFNTKEGDSKPNQGDCSCLIQAPFIFGIAYARKSALKSHPWFKSSVDLADGFKSNQEKGNDMPTYHVSLAFAQLPDTDLDEFAGAVIAGLTGNPAFPTPAVSIPDLTTGQTAFENAMTAMAQGGTQSTAAKNNARKKLIALLRQEAQYVQLNGNNDLPTLLSSGFEVNSTNTAQTPLDTPGIVQITNEMSTQLVLRVQGVDNARAYEAQVKNGTGGFQPAGTYTQSRRIILTGLTPGQTYTVQVRAVGGSTGYSDWSDPVSHMAM